MGHGSAGEEPILDFDDAISGPDESRSWVTTTSVQSRLLRCSRMSAKISSPPFRSRLPVGSSARRTTGPDQGPRDRHPLLLASRELGRPVTQPVAEPDLLQEIRGFRATFRCDTVRDVWQQDIVDGREIRDEVELRHGSKRPPFG